MANALNITLSFLIDMNFSFEEKLTYFFIQVFGSLSFLILARKIIFSVQLRYLQFDPAD